MYDVYPGEYLECLDVEFRGDMLPRMDVASNVDPLTWAMRGARCSACDVGIVRERASKIRPAQGLCVTCVCRLFLFEKVAR